MHEKSIDLLNTAIADELTAVHQYIYFHFHCDDQGFEMLAALFRKTAIEEMMHIELLAERILFLKGQVILTASDEVKPVHDAKGMLELATQMEEKSALDYNKFANECGANADNNTKKIFEALVDDEERHYNQFDDELDSMARFGDNYLALQTIERSRSASAGAPGGAGAEA